MSKLTVPDSQSLTSLLVYHFPVLRQTHLLKTNGETIDLHNVIYNMPGRFTRLWTNSEQTFSFSANSGMSWKGEMYFPSEVSGEAKDKIELCVLT